MHLELPLFLHDKKGSVSNDNGHLPVHAPLRKSKPAPVAPTATTTIATSSGRTNRRTAPPIRSRKQPDPATMIRAQTDIGFFSGARLDFSGLTLFS